LRYNAQRRRVSGYRVRQSVQGDIAEMNLGPVRVGSRGAEHAMARAVGNGRLQYAQPDRLGDAYTPPSLCRGCIEHLCKQLQRAEHHERELRRRLDGAIRGARAAHICEGEALP
jgi:hypothetical protein